MYNRSANQKVAKVDFMIARLNARLILLTSRFSYQVMGKAVFDGILSLTFEVVKDGCLEK